MQEPQENSPTPITKPTASPIIETSSPEGGLANTALIQQIFMGPNGLRAGWRLAIYVAAFLVLLSAIFLVLPYLVPPSRGRVPPLWMFLVRECISLISAVLPAFVLARFEGRRFGDYGLPGKGAFGGRFWVGALWGIVAFSILILVMRGIGVFSFGALALHGSRMLKFAVFWAVLFLMVGLFEEFLTRGYTLFTLAQGMGFWPAAVLLSAAFGGFHLSNSGEGWMGASGAAAIGLFFSLTLRRTGNLWFAVGMHMSWDWSETYLYSVPDSGLVLPGHLLNSSFHGPMWLTGGSVGPEGSVLVLVLIAGMWVMFDRVYPAKIVAGTEASSTNRG